MSQVVENFKMNTENEHPTRRNTKLMVLCISSMYEKTSGRPSS